MIQQRLFNLAWYDVKKNRYVIETTKSKIIIFANDDGTIKKTQGMKHRRSFYETNSAKCLAEMVAGQIEKKYIDPGNLLPQLYNQKQEAIIKHSRLIDKRGVTHWEKCVTNLIRQGCSVTSTGDSNIYKVVHDGRSFDESRYRRAKTFALVKRG